MTPRLWQHQPRAIIRQRIGTWFWRLTNVLGIAMMLLVAVAAAIATREHFAQSASALVTVVRMEPATWRSGKHNVSGQAITYEFTVAGTTFRDTENRTWVDVPAARPKVCYDPANPQRSHFLAQRSYACAGWNPLQDYGQFHWSRDGR